MLSVQFTWHGFQKDVSSMFIGTSPEFELALYTVCFLSGQEENVVEVGDYQVRIKAYRIKSKYGDKVGSCYPEVMLFLFMHHASSAFIVSLGKHLPVNVLHACACRSSKIVFLGLTNPAPEARASTQIWLSAIGLLMLVTKQIITSQACVSITCPVLGKLCARVALLQKCNIHQSMQPGFPDRQGLQSKQQ